MSDSPCIGIFDSGMGGQAAAIHLQKKLPNVRVAYYADRFHLPLGDKSPKVIITSALHCAKKLQCYQPDLLFIACNTACAYALDQLRASLLIPLVDVIEPTVRVAMSATKNGRVGVIGTKATIESEVYLNQLSLLLPEAELFSVACPAFVPLIEQGERISLAVIRETLQPLSIAGIDTLIMGCTHYTWIKPFIQQVMGPSVTLVDSVEVGVGEVLSLVHSQVKV